MKKYIATATFLAAFALAISFGVGNGFNERTDVILIDYSVSEDGSKLTFKTAVPTSMGYIRGFKNSGGGVKPHYLTFYSTFGRWNSSLGAKYEFELDLEETDTEIYFNRPNSGYALVLQKDAKTGEWGRPQE